MLVRAFWFFSRVGMPSRPRAWIITLTLICGSAMGPRRPHLGQMKTTEEVSLSNLIGCNMQVCPDRPFLVY